MNDGTLSYEWFGRLGLDALPFWKMLQQPTHDHIVNGTIASAAAAMVVLGAIATLGLVTWARKWKVLWSDWLTSVDHKKIGIMYVVIAFVMLTRALIEACIMRTQQAFGLSGGFLSPDHFAQLFSTHGSIMIFFMAMPFLTGIINYVMPLQLGARDVSFPVLNSISLGLTAAGAALVMISLRVRRVLHRRLERLSAVHGHGFQPRCRARLLDLGAHVVIHRRHADRHQLRSHDLQEARARHDVVPDAAVLLDHTVHQHFDDLRDAAAHGGDLAARARPLSGLSLLHERPGRQHDELCQPVLAVRPPRGLHRDPARVRRVLGSVLDVLEQGAVRLSLAGLCNHGHCGAVVHGLGAPLLHDGPERERERCVRHRDDPDRRADRRQGVTTGSRRCFAATCASRRRSSWRSAS